MNAYKVGLDIGSTTAKMVVLDKNETMVLFSGYKRHQAKIQECLLAFLHQIKKQLGDIPLSFHITGSVGMGISEKCALSFVQEVVAATNYVHRNYPHTSTMIDIGGEDAKVVFFQDGQATDLRMNGNCAGGTGAFIDQMAILLGVSIEELNDLALRSTQIYPIASRCGVFCKTDIQNLIAKNISKEDIAASIFHAVAVQTTVTLARGCNITPPVLLCGGPLTFIPALRKAFANYLKLSQETDFILPEKGNLIPAWGAALAESDDETMLLSVLINRLESKLSITSPFQSNLSPIFNNEQEYESWKKEKEQYKIEYATLQPGLQEATIGIDSGSTTTKIVVLDNDNRILYSYYHDNNGNPIKTVENGLQKLAEECRKRGTVLKIKGGCSTGYGEDLIKAAFRMDAGIIETIAHYAAAKHISKDVSFILDIGGQDMKAIFVSNGVINRIEINEACSSGCGSFISTFAQSLDYSVEDFAKAACFSKAPCDLGTRCTVFMNSKVKQVLREGATVADIAAGLSYSVVKNCLYKVLQLKDTDVLGDHIVVQGGTMRNDSIVRSLEMLTGKQTFRSNCPELMGAIGCALYAKQLGCTRTTGLKEMLQWAQYTSKQLQCRGCENQCAIMRYTFNNENHYFSGNRCEKVYSNKGSDSEKGVNTYNKKVALLFDRNVNIPSPVSTIGIPRILNMYEEYPFWHTLFTACGIQVRLSEPSTYRKYETAANMVMSDNICFPAKLVHSHIDNLIQHNVDRIFMPFVVFEKKDKQQQNSYNCPIVSGYSEVIKSVQEENIPIDAPSVTFKDETLLYKQCNEYLKSLGIPDEICKAAFAKALKEQYAFEEKLVAYNKEVLEEGRRRHKLIILLAGRPYHSDPLIQHKVSDMIADMGVYVVTDDIIRHDNISLEETHYLSQWAFTNRILKATKWAALQQSDVQYMQMTSFGCGPDAFLIDEVRNLLKRHGKNLTLLKIDDVNNIGSIKLRVRSLVESLNFSLRQTEAKEPEAFVSTAPFTKKDKKKKIIAPFFTPFISPLIPSIMRVAGYEMETLPLSDADSCDWGLKYSNNEVCYPATLIVGDIVKAFKSGRYDPSNTCVAITQTGGQCRASNYISLIKKALIENGYTDTPVISLAFGSGIENEQSGFKVNWLKVLPIILASVLYSDCIAKFYYAAVVREKEKGQAARLRDLYLNTAQSIVEKNKPEDLLSYLYLAAKEFNKICEQKSCHKVGIVGEIFLKFNSFAQKDITSWLINQQIEVIPPLMTDFFMQGFVNLKVRQNEHLQRKNIPDFIIDWLYKKVQKQINKVNEIGKSFDYFTPFESIYEKAEKAKQVITLSTQFGEGWLISGEILSFASQDVNHVISLQPFGCIANHIVQKGIEKRIKSLYPQMNILSLDFDSSVSDVNITNRLLLFIDNISN
ncbi:acyl-CoA dehydratase activase [Bacteroides congonensis]|uniref:acyl-CoA dehydratase activase n=3 Tax=Bacteroides congonensis TaxID=1871006 RepID=UPI00189CD982|nr:acyl-CoA dehydratase activase [Bacteroides congonensis]